MEQQHHSPPRTLQEGNIQPPRAQKATGTGAAAESSSSEEEKSLEQQTMAQEEQNVALTKSDFAAMMQTALTNIPEDTIDDEGEPFTVMEQALTGLMELCFKIIEHRLLPKEFVTKWPHEADDPWDVRVMADPVILASGFSVDNSFHMWYCELKDTCPVTEQLLSHHLVTPNHLLRDMISAWCHDYSIPPPSTTAELLSIAEAPPLEEEMPELLGKLSGLPVLQLEALHRIHLLSKTSKAAQPSLDQWSDLIPKLIDLHKNWRSTWTQQLEEERLTIILNLSVHRPCKEILAMQEGLPDVLKLAANRTLKHLIWVKVAAAIAILSEFDTFRWRVLDAGLMTMLGKLLWQEDVVVRKEVCAAILALCTDDAATSLAVIDGVPASVLECLADGMVTDECLLLLERVSHNQCVLERIGDQVEQLMNVITTQHATASGLVTSRGIETAVSLIHSIVQRDVSQLKEVKNLEKYKVGLRKLASRGMTLQTLFQAGNILRLVSEVLPD